MSTQSLSENTRNSVHGYLFELWRKILRRDEIDPAQSFFAQGGGSIHVVQMLAEVSKHYDVELEYRRFFEQPTLEILLSLIDRARRS